jgi:hypothetical protein
MKWNHTIVLGRYLCAAAMVLGCALESIKSGPASPDTADKSSDWSIAPAPFAIS